MLKGILTVLAVLTIAGSAIAETIKLPPPQKTGGMPLMEALDKRCSTRVFSPKPLSKQDISNLLWAAFGVNRNNGKRTAPSARNWQEIGIFVCTAEGLFKYNAKANTLEKIFGKDIRKEAHKQKFTPEPPVFLVYAADFRKISTRNMRDKVFYSATDTGFISQNVYLFCAANKMSTVVLGYIDRDKLRKAMKLDHNYNIILTQPVGYMAK